jgi:hypothetical protein
MRGARRPLGRRQVAPVAHPVGDVACHREPGEGGIGLEHHPPAPVGRGERLAPQQDAPELGASSPPTIRISVVFPQPDGPRKATSSPSATVRSKGATTSVAPYRFVTLSKAR